MKRALILAAAALVVGGCTEHVAVYCLQNSDGSITCQRFSATPDDEILIGGLRAALDRCEDELASAQTCPDRAPLRDPAAASPCCMCADDNNPECCPTGFEIPPCPFNLPGAEADARHAAALAAYRESLALGLIHDADEVTR